VILLEKKLFSGVRSEMKKVRWPKKKEMVKYSIAVLLCIAAFAIFFIFSDFIIAGVRTLVGGN
jgi:preprotein translocase subunit SecE